MNATDPWAVLGIAPTRDVAQIRRAYAARLKVTNPEQDAAAFAALRSAYETALARARFVVAPVTTVVPPVAAPVVDERPHVGDTATPQPPAHEAGSTSTAPAAPAPPKEVLADIERLRADFYALQQLLIAPEPSDPQMLQSVLERCLSAPALENLGVRLEFEPAMAQFLWRNPATTESLLEIVIERWNWRERRLSASTLREIPALVARADNCRHLENLRVSQPRVYRTLTRPPRTPWLWLRLVCSLEFEQSVREGLVQFQGVTGCMPAAVNAQALAWWQRFFTRPHLRPVLLQVAIALSVGTLLLGLHGAREDALTTLLEGIGTGVAIPTLWFLLIDWPRFKLKSRRRTASPLLRFGWAPGTLTLCIVAALLPDGVAVAGVVGVFSLVLVCWAVLMAPEVEDGLVRQRMVQRMLSALLINVPVATWWGLLAAKADEAPTLPMWVSFIAALLAFAIGQPLLWIEYSRGLNLRERQWGRATAGAAALAMLAVLWAVTIGDFWKGPVLAIITSLVLAQRAAAGNLTPSQLKARYYIGWVAVVFGGRALADVRLLSLERAAGIFFMAGAVLTMCACLSNEWRAAREAPQGVDLRSWRQHAE